MWFVSVALAGPVSLAHFRVPLRVRAHPVDSARPACNLRFEWLDPESGWRRFVDFHLSALPEDGLGDGGNPPHDLAIDGLVRGRAIGWRIADPGGAVVTAFTGPYAIDARPLAERLGEVRAWREGRREPDCHPTADHECWTAMDLWLYLEDWRSEHCPER